jgi:hypothetical protein
MTRSKSQQPVIVGAGLAGLLAAHAWPNSTIIEAADEPRQVHRALLRFRSEAVSHLTGIPFRRVQVRKGIWANGPVAPSIQLANMYARKCLGRIVGERSIWNLDPVTRWVAPDDLYEQLIDACSDRIIWRTRAPYDDPRTPVVSTAPLPVVLNKVGLGLNAPEFRRAAITVSRHQLKDVDAFQTIYFPDPELKLYRASITGSTLICEYVGEPTESQLSLGVWAADEAFGLGADTIGPNEVTKQPLGKIEPLPDAQRKALLFRLTNEHNVFSLGRFATWRNILLDDVVDDIGVIKRLIDSSAYDLRHHAAR